MVVNGSTIHPRLLHKGTWSIIMLTAWSIWKHRNTSVFDYSRHFIATTFDMIRAEAHLWANAGAIGLHQLHRCSPTSPSFAWVELYGAVLVQSGTYTLTSLFTNPSKQCFLRVREKWNKMQPVITHLQKNWFVVDYNFYSERQWWCYMENSICV
jgi:hypothetical protein